MNNDLNNERRGITLVLSSPSGAGKTSLSRKLLERNKKLFLSVSCTTRPPRPGEFNEMQRNNEFLESAKVFDHYYGTPKKPIMDALDSGLDILFDIDWQGTQQLMNSLQDDLIKVFVLPPSAKELERRLLQRNQDSDEIVKGRMSKASNEISHYAEYDYIIINENFEESLSKIESIIIAEGLKRSRQIKIQDTIDNLLKDL